MMTITQIKRAEQIVEAWPNKSDADVAKMIVGPPVVSAEDIRRIRVRIMAKTRGAI